MAHSNFFLNSHRKNRENSLKPKERAMSTPILPQIVSSKFS